MADELLGPAAPAGVRGTQGVLPVGGRGGAGTGTAGGNLLLERIDSSLKGIQHAFQTQLTRTDESSDQTKILGYKPEHKMWVFAARGFDDYHVELCPGVEGIPLFRRLTEIAQFEGKVRATNGKRWKLSRRHRTVAVTVGMGTDNPLAPEEGCLMASDFQKCEIDKIFHYCLPEEPANGKLEAHGQLARTWPAFEEQAIFEAEFFVELYGSYYGEQLLSGGVNPATGKVIGFLYVLKDLHYREERRFSIVVVVTVWERAFAHFRTKLAQKLNRLSVATKKPLRDKDDLRAAAKIIGPDGYPLWTPPESFWSDSAGGILREVIFPELEFDKKWIGHSRRSSNGNAP